MGTQLHDLTGLEQAQAVRSGEVSPVELVRHHLDRVERLDDRVSAFVTVTADRAIEQARAAEQRVREGGELPPLLGVPTAVKDLNLTAGIPTSFGSAVMADFVPQVDDAVVSRLAASGAISLGKTATPEFGLPCYTEPAGRPATRSPWGTDRMAGGSSGGAGAAVAAGFVPFAQGSDGGGSIRIPASCNGLVGLKTSRGRISSGPVGVDVNGLSVNGPLARTVADCAALLDVLAGPGVGDPHWAPPLPAGETFAAHAAREPGRLVIGRYTATPIDGAVLHPECRQAWDDASALLERLGHTVVDVEPPFGPDLLASFTVLWSVSAASLPLPSEAEEQLRPLTRWLRELGRGRSAVDWQRAMVAVQQASRAAITATAHCDAVLVPTLAQPPLPVGALRDDDDPAADFAAQTRFTPYTAQYNSTGQPAMSLPLHQTGDGLPVGVMLVGRPAGEAALLQLAAQVEQAAPWSDRHPPIWTA